MPTTSAAALEDLRRRLRQLAETQDDGRWIIKRKQQQVNDKIDNMIAGDELTTLDINGLVLKDWGLVELALWGKMHPQVALQIRTIDVGRNLSGGKGLMILALSLMITYKNCQRVVVGGGNWCGWSRGVLRISKALRNNGGGTVDIRCRGDYEIFNIAAKLQELPPGPRIIVNVDCWPSVTKRGASALQTEALAVNDISCTVNAPGVVNKGYVMVPPIPEGNSCSAEFIEVCSLKTATDVQEVADFISITNASKIKFRKQASTMQVLLAAFSNSCITDLEVQTTSDLVDLQEIGIRATHISRVTSSNFDARLLAVFPNLIQLVCNSTNDKRHDLRLTSSMSLRTIIYHNGYNLLKSGLDLATKVEVFECNRNSLPLLTDASKMGSEDQVEVDNNDKIILQSPSEIRNLQTKLDQDLEYGTSNAGLRLKELRALLLCWKRVLSTSTTSSLNELVGFGFMEPFGALIKKPKAVILNYILKLPMGGAPPVSQLSKNSPFSVGGWSTIARHMQHKNFLTESGMGYSISMTTDGTESSIPPECVVVEDTKYVIAADAKSVANSEASFDFLDSRSCGIYPQQCSSGGSTTCSKLTLGRLEYVQDTMSLRTSCSVQLQAASVAGRNLLDEVNVLKRSFATLRGKGRIPDELFLVVGIRAKLVIHRKSGAQNFHIAFTIQTGGGGASKSTCAELAKQYKRDLPRDHRKRTVVTIKPKRRLK
eukprot:TRINITY_DN10465_c0_g1_i1.p1 TRINITY_DN10465_c0_g1~~TRINITY_DN10465_c0_g1_i1.p1  ORF type:complete len:739 (+),score=133.32 TRINITY_DN10465_c0_g1_i1:81-2219(+)